MKSTKDNKSHEQITNTNQITCVLYSYIVKKQQKQKQCQEQKPSIVLLLFIFKGKTRKTSKHI